MENTTGSFLKYFVQTKTLATHCYRNCFDTTASQYDQNRITYIICKIKKKEKEKEKEKKHKLTLFV